MEKISLQRWNTLPCFYAHAAHTLCPASPQCPKQKRSNQSCQSRASSWGADWQLTVIMLMSNIWKQITLSHPRPGSSHCRCALSTCWWTSAPGPRGGTLWSLRCSLLKDPSQYNSNHVFHQNSFQFVGNTLEIYWWWWCSVDANLWTHIELARHRLCWSPRRCRGTLPIFCLL